MIVFLPLKKFLKYKEEFVAPQPYIIVNCISTDASRKLSKFRNCTSVKPLIPPARLVRESDDESITQAEREVIVLGDDEKENLIQTFLYKDDFANAIGIYLYQFIKYGGEYNVYFVMTGKMYRLLGKRFAERVMSIVNNRWIRNPVTEEIFFTGSEIASKEKKRFEILSSIPSEKTLKLLDENLAAYEEGIRELQTKKEKDKFKDKGSKKKKKKHDL